MVMSKRERYIGIACGLVLGLLVIDRVFFTPLKDRLDELGDINGRGLIGQAQLQLTGARRTLETGKLAKSAWSSMTAGGKLFTNESDAESRILNDVNTWGQQARLSIQSQKRERAEPHGGFMELTYRVTATGGMAQVGQFLYLIQNADIPVRVTDFQLNSKKDGTDELTVSAAIATIYQLPVTDKTQQRGGASADAGWEAR